MLEHKEQYFLAALLTAQFQHPGSGFRQRDLKFYLELYLNWVKHPYSDDFTEVQNVQIKRFLEDLDDQGLLVKKKDKTHPNYRLNRAGLLETIKRFVEKEDYEDSDHILFTFYFIRAYRERIIYLIKKEGKSFPTAIKIEIETLLDYDALLQKLLSKLDIFISQLQARIIDNQHSAKLVESMEKKGHTASEILDVIEKEHPYQLNSLKPLSKLLEDFPTEIQLDELRTNSLQRVEMIWKKQLEHYKLLRKQLVSLC